MGKKSKKGKTRTSATNKHVAAGQGKSKTRLRSQSMDSQDSSEGLIPTNGAAAQVLQQVIAAAEKTDAQAEAELEAKRKEIAARVAAARAEQERVEQEKAAAEQMVKDKVGEVTTKTEETTKKVEEAVETVQTKTVEVTSRGIPAFDAPAEAEAKSAQKDCQCTIL